MFTTEALRGYVGRALLKGQTISEIAQACEVKEQLIKDMMSGADISLETFNSIQQWCAVSRTEERRQKKFPKPVPAKNPFKD